jgi:hypothetical protein
MYDAKCFSIGLNVWERESTRWNEQGAVRV